MGARYISYIRGLGFKFVDSLYKSSEVGFIEIKIMSSKNTIFYLSYEILSTVLLIWFQHNNESKTMTLHNPGHAVETLTSKLCQF